MKHTAIIRELRSHANADNVAGMARFGINPKTCLGIKIPVLRAMAKRIGKDHTLAQRLWVSGLHEARILASMVDEPERLTRRQMDAWARDFDSWDLCDQCCMNLFEKTPHAHPKALQWSGRKAEFVKRAGFVLMARLAFSDKTAPDRMFTRYFPIIRQEATDERNFVKKAVNWALRQIGKRNKRLHRLAIAEARALARLPSPGARWIARDALRELQDPKTRARLDP